MADRLSKGDDDAWLYFYEFFLETYDNKLRKLTGSYYTPRKVVQAMARLTDDALRDPSGSASLAVCAPTRLPGRVLHSNARKGMSRFSGCPEAQYGICTASRAWRPQRGEKSGTGRHLEQALDQSDGLAERKAEKGFQRQACLDRGIRERLGPSPLAGLLCLPNHAGVEPDQERAPLPERRVAG